MDEILKNRWLTWAFLGGSLAVIGGFVLYIVLNPFVPGYVRSGAMPAHLTEPAAPPVPGDRIPLLLDEAVPLGTLRLFYRGIDAGTIRIDVIIPALDSVYPYPHRLSREQAESGFRLAGRKFRLVSANRSKLRLLLME